MPEVGAKLRVMGMSMAPAFSRWLLVASVKAMVLSLADMVKVWVAWVPMIQSVLLGSAMVIW